MNTIRLPIVGPRAPMPTRRDGGADFAVYDPKADRCTTLPNLPTQRNHLAADAIDGKIYVVGGRFEGGFRSQRTGAGRGF
jgi:hypothetical protein